eukprot:8822375-Pyramimonas_sp.AAC.1
MRACVHISPPPGLSLEANPARSSPPVQPPPGLARQSCKRACNERERDIFPLLVSMRRGVGAAADSFVPVSGCAEAAQESPAVS